MPKRILLSKKEKNVIVKLYKENNLSLKKIAKIINKSQSFVERILKDEGVYQTMDGITLKKQEVLKKEGFNFIAICKKTGKTFKDYENSSGALTVHLKKYFTEIVHPSNYQKRKYETANNKYWHELFFDIVEVKEENKPKKKCVYCSWETVDIYNKSGMYLTHLKKEHKNISLQEHLNNFPEDTEYFKKQSIELQKEKLKNKETVNYITCKICNKKFRKISNSHLLNKHNITTEEYKQKYSNSPIVCDETKKYSVDVYNKVLKYKENKFTSSAHIQISDFITSLGFSVKNNDKKLLKGIEIDILINETNLGIEFNGILFHSELFGKKLKDYHLNKTLMMNSENHSLIHIFEDEWALRQDIVKSKLMFLLNKFNGEKIHARKCIVKEIHPSLKNAFLEKNHIQGKDSSTIGLGVFYNNYLVSVMTFDNSRGMVMGNKNNKDFYELSRFCVDNKYIIAGIAGKLLSYFIKNYNPKKIISFADRRWTLSSTENLYTKLGFKLTKTLSPDYTYYNSKINRFKRFHKFSFGKSSLKNKFPEIYSDNKTEWEMMQELGYDRIWDCGKFKYELNL